MGNSGCRGHVDAEEGPTGETPPYDAGTLVVLPEGGRARGTLGAVAPLVGRHRGGRLSEWTMVVTGTLPAPAGAFLHGSGTSHQAGGRRWCL